LRHRRDAAAKRAVRKRIFAKGLLEKIEFLQKYASAFERKKVLAFCKGLYKKDKNKFCKFLPLTRCYSKTYVKVPFSATEFGFLALYFCPLNFAFPGFCFLVSSLYFAKFRPVNLNIH